MKLFSTFCKGKFIQRDKNIITKKVFYSFIKISQKQLPTDSIFSTQQTPVCPAEAKAIDHCTRLNEKNSKAAAFLGQMRKE